MHEILQLKRQGLSVTAISGLTGFDRKTVRKYLAEPEAVPVYGPREPRPTVLDPYRPYIEERLAAGVWNAVVLLRELQARGYCGSYTVLKDYLRPKRKAAREVATRRFETPPGQQAQVDWGDLGRVTWPDGSRQSLYGFVFTLGHSRAMFADVATDQRLGTLLWMHEAAFAALGGVPQEILYDQMKTVALGVDARGEIDWQPLFFDFARYWGFAPRLCRAYRPQTKGKVESGIRYVRSNFLCGRRADDVPDLRRQLAAWTAEVANQRVHGTTHQRVDAAWQAERERLQPLAGRASFPCFPQERRRVARDAYVAYRANRYSVPWTAVGQEVSLREAGAPWAARLEIRSGSELLAVHSLCPGRHQVLTIPAHHAGLPFSPSGGPSGKARIEIEVRAPEVEVRELTVYEELAAPPVERLAERLAELSGEPVAVRALA